MQVFVGKNHVMGRCDDLLGLMRGLFNSGSLRLPRSSLRSRDINSTLHSMPW